MAGAINMVHFAKTIAGTKHRQGTVAYRRFGSSLTFLFFLLFLCLPAQAADSGSVEDLQNLSIDDLGNVSVYSVSKSEEPLSDAPAAIYVISHEDIRRSGATTLPEMLRLAPNLVVAQVSGSGYAISARGFNGTTTTNGAGNKLLVLIDGRSVYTPLYGGVFWDLQYIPPQDIDRIEVISGPGAALWGANAVNGVINIITRNSADTQGQFVSLSDGTIERQVMGQYGGSIGTATTLRIYATGYQRDADDTTTGADTHDNWGKIQGGFRLDWNPKNAEVTLQGDAFGGTEQQASGPSAVIGGQNLLVRWNQTLANGSALQVQAYYDFNTLHVPGSIGDSLTTFDFDVQHSIAWGSRQEIIWGGDYRTFHDIFDNVPSLQFIPARTTESLESGFVQDTISLTGALKLVVGTKLENDPFMSAQWLPNARLSWKLSDTSMIWTAVSRAVRAPTLWDRDLNELSGSTTVLSGGHFQSEELMAYEAGFRAQSTSNFSFSASAYYNVYSDLRSIEVSPTPDFLPLVYGNMMEGTTYGAEIWGSYRLTDWWFVSAGVNLEHEDLRFKPGSSMFGGLQAAGNDPTQQELLRSSWDLPHNIEFDVDARYEGALPNPAQPAYVGVNARLGWHATDHLDLAITGTNLTGKHSEFGSIPGAVSFAPNVLATVQWSF